MTRQPLTTFSVYRLRDGKMVFAFHARSKSRKVLMNTLMRSGRFAKGEIEIRELAEKTEPQP